MTDLEKMELMIWRARATQQGRRVEDHSALLVFDLLLEQFSAYLKTDETHETAGK